MVVHFPCFIISEILNEAAILNQYDKLITYLILNYIQ
jgi:hypothetical protein